MTFETKVKVKKNQTYYHAYQTLIQHLVEYQKQILQEENQKSGNVMQQTMHSYVFGINLRSESSLVLSDLHFA